MWPGCLSSCTSHRSLDCKSAHLRCIKMDQVQASRQAFSVICNTTIFLGHLHGSCTDITKDMTYGKPEQHLKMAQGTMFRQITPPHTPRVAGQLNYSKLHYYLYGPGAQPSCQAQAGTALWDALVYPALSPTAAQESSGLLSYLQTGWMSRCS